MNSSDITRARRLQLSNNDLRFPNKSHNLTVLHNYVFEDQSVVNFQEKVYQQI
jgi:hypothetical protein